MTEKPFKTSELILRVNLDENNVPLDMKWKATDLNKDFEPVKAFILSLWDEKEQNALRIDLWSKNQTVDEMKIFFHQTLLTMADTFERATGEKKMSDDLRDYCYHFAEKMKII
jgi:gliding motility-associated protein GldC